MVTDNTKTAFFIEGFVNWKKATESIKHLKFNKESKLKFSSINVPTIQKKLSTAAAEAIVLLKVLSSLNYLLRQGLAIRGHMESDGNLYQLLLL